MQNLSLSWILYGPSLIGGGYYQLEILCVSYWLNIGWYSSFLAVYAIFFVCFVCFLPKFISYFTRVLCCIYSLQIVLFVLFTGSIMVWKDNFIMSDSLHMSGGQHSEVSNWILNYDLSVWVELPNFPITKEFWVQTMWVIVHDQYSVSYFQWWVLVYFGVIVLWPVLSNFQLHVLSKVCVVHALMWWCRPVLLQCCLDWVCSIVDCCILCQSGVEMVSVLLDVLENVL